MKRQRYLSKPQQGWLVRIEATVASVDVEWREGGREAVDDWLEDHKCPPRDDFIERHGSLTAESGSMFGGPVGGVLQFVVVGTGVGTFVHAQCGCCGDRLEDLTNLVENF